jgi:hypothetical protein
MPSRLAIVMLLAMGSTATADHEPPREKPKLERSYRHQVLISDAASALGIVGGMQFKSSVPYGLGLAGYGLAAPIIHVVNGRPLRGLASLGLRLALPILGGFAGEKYLRDECPPDSGFCNDALPTEGFFRGLAVGAIVAAAVDAVVIARPVRVEAGWAPTAHVTRDGFTIGAGGTF